MRASHLLLFIVTLPFLAALGHDIYLFIINGGSVDVLQESIQTTMDNSGEPGVKSLFATAGFIWTHYHPESYKWVFENIDEQSWAVINLILAQKAVVVGAVFAGFFYVLFFLASLFAKKEGGMGSSSSRSRIDKVLNKKGKGGTLKYKRK